MGWVKKKISKSQELVPTHIKDRVPRGMADDSLLPRPSKGTRQCLARYRRRAQQASEDELS